MMWSKFKSLYQPPSAEAIAIKELDDARRSLLEAQSAKEYAESMCQYHDSRIRRLSAYLHTNIPEAD